MRSLDQRHQWVFVITTLRNCAEFAVRGIWKYLYRDYNFVQKPLWSWSGLYHLLLSPNQWLPEVFVWTQWACFQEGANNRVVTSVTIVTSWVSPDYVNHGADEVFSQFLAASNIQIAPGLTFLGVIGVRYELWSDIIECLGSECNLSLHPYFSRAINFPSVWALLVPVPCVTLRPAKLQHQHWGLSRVLAVTVVTSPPSL